MTNRCSYSAGQLRARPVGDISRFLVAAIRCYPQHNGIAAPATTGTETLNRSGRVLPYCSAIAVWRREIACCASRAMVPMTWASRNKNPANSPDCRGISNTASVARWIAVPRGPQSAGTSTNFAWGPYTRGQKRRCDRSTVTRGGPTRGASQPHPSSQGLPSREAGESVAYRRGAEAPPLSPWIRGLANCYLGAGDIAAPI